MALPAGEMAPDFELGAVTGTLRHTVKLSDYRDKSNVVLVFHPADWTPTCTAELQNFNKHKQEFSALGAELLDISVDSVYSHIAWQEREIGMMDFPLASDFFPHGAVAEAYGVLRTDAQPLAGISERAVFIVDKSGRIAFSTVSPLDIAPKPEAILAELEKLATV